MTDVYEEPPAPPRPDGPAPERADALAALAARFEILLDGAPLGIAFLDRDLRVEQVNAALAAVLGTPARECRGRGVRELVPELAPAIVPSFEQVLGSGTAVSEVSLSGVAPGTRGQVRHWRASLFPVRAAPDQVSGVGIVLRDVTARKEASDRERRRARHREALHSLAGELLSALTPDEVVAAAVAQTSSAFRAAGAVIARRTDDGLFVELLGAKGMPDDLAAEWRRFPLDAPVPLAFVARTGQPVFLESPDDWAREFPVLVATATEIGHRANAVVPLVADGRPIGALGIAFDAPRTFDQEERDLALSVARQCALALERARLLEAERAARAEADEANRAKTSFLTTMSHELRTPLNAIAGYAQLIDMGLYGPVSDQQRQAIARIQRSKDHLLTLVANLLDLAKLATGRLELEVADVSLHPLVEFAGEATAPQCRARGIDYEARCPHDLVVRADADKVRQILLNLLANAIKFTEPGGRLRVRASRADRLVRIEVEDSGCGIATDQLERIFDPFVQVDRRLNRPIEGTGLGLAISRELARALGGDLAATSTPAAGSIFTLTLPAAG